MNAKVQSAVGGPVQPRRRMSAASRREVILAAAMDAFSDAHYHETSLDEVAERAGVSKALIYEHFASKRELQGALLRRASNEILTRIGVAVAAVTEHGEARLEAGLDAFLTFTEEDRDAWRLLFRSVSDPEVAAELDRLEDEATRVIAGLMSAEVPPERGSDPLGLDFATEMFARQLLGSVQSLAVWWDQHREVPREQILAIAMEYSWMGLERVTTGERWASR